MPNRRYRLLKPLPDANVGTILTETKTVFKYKGRYDDENEMSWYIKSVVENNTEFFQEIKDEPQEATTKEGFKWNDELVKEFIHTRLFAPPSYPYERMTNDINDFKQSKQSPKQDSSKEINEVKYTQSDLDAAQKEAFEAGRDRIVGFWNNEITNWKYTSFNHYKISKK